jgi:hypothetical protein
LVKFYRGRVGGSKGGVARQEDKEFGHPHPGPPPSKRAPVGPQGAGEERRGGEAARYSAAEAAKPMGQETPVPPRPQYPLGFFDRNCW